MVEQYITYFGYGSLVNRNTRPGNEVAEPATLYGWQRSWSHRVESKGRRLPCSSLTVSPVHEDQKDSHPGIQGVVVSMPASELAVLDAREAGYQRLRIPASEFHLPPGCDASEVLVYQSLPDNQHAATPDFPILQSYIDCVMAGYLDFYGDHGLSAFMASTQGWHLPVENDRQAPHYPRAVTLSEALLLDFSTLIRDYREL